MQTAILINSLSIVFGGLVSGLMGHKLSDSLKFQLNLVFGACSMGIGITAIGLMKYMPAVILALILGTLLGLQQGWRTHG